MTEAVQLDTTSPDARLLALLTETREAEAEYSAAVAIDNEDGWSAAGARLEAALDAMAETPAASWQGVAAKAARICRSLRDGGGVMYVDVPVAASLAADLARLAPEVVA